MMDKPDAGLDEIRARHEDVINDSPWDVHHDRATLLDYITAQQQKLDAANERVEELEADNGALARERNILKDKLMMATTPVLPECEATELLLGASVEQKRQRARIETLKAALRGLLTKLSTNIGIDNTWVGKQYSIANLRDDIEQALKELEA